MFGFDTPKVVKKEQPTIPFRESLAWDGFLREGINELLLEDIVGMVDGSGMSVREDAVSAINDLLNEKQEFSQAIDMETSGWYEEIGKSGNERDDERNEEALRYGKALIGKLVLLVGGKENLVTLLVERIRGKKEREEGKESDI